VLPVELEGWLEGVDDDVEPKESRREVGDCAWDDDDGLGLALGSIDDDVSLLPG
jgi:hypothetical protein